MSVSLFLSGTPFLVTKNRDSSPDLAKCEKERENCGKDTFIHSFMQKWLKLSIYKVPGTVLSKSHSNAEDRHGAYIERTPTDLELCF